MLKKHLGKRSQKQKRITREDRSGEKWKKHGERITKTWEDAIYDLINIDRKKKKRQKKRLKSETETAILGGNVGKGGKSASEKNRKKTSKNNETPAHEVIRTLWNRSDAKSISRKKKKAFRQEGHESVLRAGYHSSLEPKEEKVAKKQRNEGIGGDHDEAADSQHEG